MTEANTPKATKVRRWRVTPNGADLMAPDGTWHAVSRDIPDSAHIWAYGMGQKYGDKLFAIDKKKGEAPPTMADFAAFMETVKSGGLFERSAKADVEPTLESVAEGVVRKLLGKDAAPERVTAGVAKLLDPAHPKHTDVCDAYTAEHKAWTVRQNGGLTLADLGL